MNRLPKEGTTRAGVSEFALEHRGLLAGPVVEIGSRRDYGSWWADLRGQLELDDVEWVGVDLQSGGYVDVVFDMTRDLSEWPAEAGCKEGPRDRFGSCVCAEVLEHVNYPAKMLANIRRILKPGAWLIVTTPFAFPAHAYPDDYWRFTPSGLRLLLTDAGFVQIKAFERAVKTVTFYDHDDVPAQWTLPQHVCAVARKQSP